MLVEARETPPHSVTSISIDEMFATPIFASVSSSTRSVDGGGA